MPPNTSNVLASSKHFQDNPITQMGIKLKRKLRWYEPESEIIWLNAISIVILHVMSIYYYITFPYFDNKFLILWTFLMGHMGGLGVTAGAHRLWAHRTYKANMPVRIFLAMCFYSVGQNSIFNWVRDHRLHHKYTDTEADPHNNNRGFFFSHVGWLMLRKKNEVRQCGRGIDMTDILEDPVVQFFDRNFRFWNTLFTFVLPIFVPVYFFNQDLKWTFVSVVFLRYTWLLNVTWSVNSFAHMFGNHSYDKSIRPAENIFVGFFAGGEGWHNYHHTFPWDYKAAEFHNFFFNVTAHWIDLFAKIGLVTDRRQASSDMIKRFVEKKGDGSHYTINKSLNDMKTS